MKSSGADAVLPLAIVILNWNLPDETLACLDSVRAAVAAIPQVRLIIVDNGSSDDSAARLGRAAVDSRDLPVTLLETGRNLGFAGGMNAGIRWALQQGAATVLALNNDTVVDAAMVGQLLAEMATRPDAGLVGPVIYTYDAPDRIWRFGDKEHWLWPIPYRLPDRMATETQGAPFAVDYITGCAMLARASALEAAGLFDERYFMYFEDADLCRRVRAAGFGIYVVPKAKLWHKVSLSANRDRPLNRYARAWARVRFYRRHPHGRLPALAHGYIWAKVLLVSAQDLLRREPELVAPLWRGTLDGYRDGYPDGFTPKGAEDAKERREQ